MPYRRRFNEAEAIRLGKSRAGRTARPDPASFNEAEAIRLGKSLEQLKDISGEIGASMRPRQFASENRDYSSILCGEVWGFNEAEAIRLGK